MADGLSRDRLGALRDYYLHQEDGQGDYEDIFRHIDALESRLLSLAEQHQELRKAVIEARRELWWFVERETGNGWGFEESDVAEICSRAMHIQDEVLAPALRAEEDAG